MTSPYFDYFVVLVIVVSGVELALESPLMDPASPEMQVLLLIDLSTTVVFALESLMKILAFGLAFNGPASYLRNGWNINDFIIVVFSVISLTPLPSQLKSFKMLRVVRILRLLNKNEGLQVAVKALFQAVPQIISISVIMLLFFLIFSIIGVSYFKGRYFHCDASGVAFAFEAADKWACLDFGGLWVNRSFSFDNVLEGVRTCFQMATTSNWADVMFASINTSRVDFAPVKDNNIGWIPFFVLFIVFGAFFMLNLFVGVVISTFNREKDKIGGNHLLTESQKQWIDTKLIALKAQPIKVVKEPSNAFRKFCFNLQQSKWVDRLIFVCILLNTLVLMIKHYRESAAQSLAEDALNYVFTLVFTLEAAVKLAALGGHYFKDNWNIFDFVVVLLSVLSVVITSLSSLKVGAATTIVRSFRIARVFRLVKQARSLRVVFNSFIYTLPALANVGGLLLLLLYLYAIIGVILFGALKRNGILGDVLNFETFDKAFISLFVVATGDNWDKIMKATLHNFSIDFQCVANPSYADYAANGFQPVGCGSVASGLLFFYSYFFLVVLIFLNLFIAIILEGYEETQQKENKLFNQEKLDAFRQVWAQFDPDATTYIRISQLKALLFALGKPLGWDAAVAARPAYQDRFIANLDLPIYNSFSDYMFMDVLEALALRVVIIEQLEREKGRLRQRDLDDLEAETDERETQRMLKDKIQKDINKLKYQEKAQGIAAVKEVERAAQRRKTMQSQNQQFTSIHQAAALETIKQMKFMVQRKKFALQRQEQHATGTVQADKSATLQLKPPARSLR